MAYNYDKLRGKIKECYKTQESFANALKIGKVSLSQRLTCKLDFSQTEIKKACELLYIKPEEIIQYFFNEKV